MRKHASTFVDRRDLLESKINKLNSKLAYLMAESREWQRSFDVFKEVDPPCFSSLRQGLTLLPV